MGFLSIFIGVGATIDAMAVFVKPMSESLGWTRTLIMGAVTVAAVATSFVSPLVGRVIDRYGARILMPVSAIAGGGLFVAISWVNHPWQFYLLFGVGVGIARPCFSLMAATTTISNWFIVERGRALALCTMGAAISALVIIPYTQWVLTTMTWRAAWVMLGILTWTLLALPAAVIIRRRPEDMGLLPDGVPVEEDKGKSAREPVEGTKRRSPKTEENWSARAAMRTHAFWLILFSLVLTSFPIMGVWLHASASFTDQGVSPAKAALAMGCVAITSIPSRLFWGLVAERLHLRYCILITNLGLAASVIFIMLATNFPMALGSMLLYGVFVGGSIVLQVMVWPEYFGRLALGAIAGYAELFRVVGTAGGPLLAGIIYDVYGSYYIAFSAFAGGCLLATLLMYLAKPPLIPDKAQVQMSKF
ncbi:MAG: MFS transporter [Deltaproteobacteria bacterium]|nr:MFS transporter [Deltaproteobacteria bacterium]MBW2085702.1 MFS transporter [Deltaproteobacteria bacterium]